MRKESDSPMFYRKNPRTAWQSVGEVTVVIHLGTNRMIGLDQSAGYVWRCLDQPVAPAAIAAHLEAAGAVADLESAAGAIGTFTALLADWGLVEPVSLTDAAPAALPDAPERFGAPTVLWQEELRTVAATCAKIGGQSGACSAVPTT